MRAAIERVEPETPVPPELATKATSVTFQQVATQQDLPRLEPESIELAGQTAQTELVLNNRGAVPITVGLAGSDRAQALAFEFVGGPRRELPAGQSLRIPLRITCLDRTRLAPPPAPTHFTVVVTPLQPAGDARSVRGSLTVPGPADFNLHLEPARVESSSPERVQLVIQNASPRQAVFAINATSADLGLTVAAAQTRVDIPVNSQVAVPVLLTPRSDGAEPVPGGARASDFTLHVAPLDAPARAKQVAGQYIYAAANVRVRLLRNEIEAAGEAAFDLQLENQTRTEVALTLEASDRAGACTYRFDLPRLRIPARSTVLVRLAVVPPPEHRADARWQFEVTAQPVSPPGEPARDEGVLIYRPPTVGLSIAPPERRGRRRRRFTVVLTNQGALPTTVRLMAVDRSGGLGVQLKRDTVDLPPAGRAGTKIPLKVTPWKRMRGSGEQALSFSVAATPISPPGDAITADARFVALPPRSRWLWLLLAFLVLIGIAFTPFYTEAFYLAGWKKGYGHNYEHHLTSDVSCMVRQLRNGEPHQIRPACFEQGPPPPTPFPHHPIGSRHDRQSGVMASELGQRAGSG